MQIKPKLIYVTIFSLMWSILVILNKFILNIGVHPLVYVMYYYAVASIVICFYTFPIKRRKIKSLSRYDIKIFLLMGSIISLAFAIAMFGLSKTTSINYGFIIKSTVIFGPLLASLFLGEKFSKKKILLIPLFFIGVYLISTQGETLILGKGDALILSAAFLFSSSDVLMKKLTKRLSFDLVATFRILSTLFFVFILVNIFVRDLSLNIPTFYFIIVIISGLISGIAQLFLLKTIDLSSISYLSMMTMMAPFFVVLIAFFFLGESFTIIHFIGGIIIIICGVLVQKYKI